MTRTRKLLLIDGFTDFNSAKTAINVIRYDRENVVGLIDSTREAGLSAQDLFGVGGEIPVFHSVNQAPDADQLILGTTPPGGALSDKWRVFIRQAIERRLDVVSGLHDFISLDPEFTELAKCKGVSLNDIRRTNFRKVATRQGIRDSCLRIHTVGHDCNVGKMVASLELAQGLRTAGHDAHFVATGQTGIMIAGDGIPIDAVVADFVNGAAEELVRKNQEHDIIVIEGQGSLVNPMFSSVTLGLLHGAMPDGLIFCYQPDRKVFRHTDIPIPSIESLIKLYETVASINYTSKVIGVAMNGRTISSEQAIAEKRTIEAALGVPVVDVIRERTTAPLVAAVLQLKSELGK